MIQQASELAQRALIPLEIGLLEIENAIVNLGKKVACHQSASPPSRASEARSRIACR